MTIAPGVASPAPSTVPTAGDGDVDRMWADFVEELARAGCHPLTSSVTTPLSALESRLLSRSFTWTTAGREETARLLVRSGVAPADLASVSRFVRGPVGAAEPGSAVDGDHFGDGAQAVAARTAA